MKNIIKQIINHLHSNKIDRLCTQKNRKINKKINKVTVSPAVIKEYKSVWNKLSVKPSKVFLQNMISVSGKESSLYVPENIQYNIIEPTLNNQAYAVSFNDKNFFEIFLPESRNLFPISIFRGCDGVVLDNNYNYINITEIKEIIKMNPSQEFIIKPATETGGGGNVQRILKTDKGIKYRNRTFSYEKFISECFYKDYKNNFVLQQRIKGYKWFSDFNKSSINTVRLYTYRSVVDNTVHPLHAYIRFGQDGSIVDSSSQDGFTCGVKLNGVLNNFVVTKYGKKLMEFKGVDNKFGTVVPYFAEMISLAKDIAPKFLHHRLLGFDFFVDDNGDIKLFEINNLYIGVINQQMSTGPLYGKFTQEIIEYCLNNKKSVSTHYYL